MVYEWDEKRARRAQLGKWAATFLVAVVLSAISAAVIVWWS